jgi:N-methylhydantoinase B
VITFDSAGGGGFGDPLDRDIAAVERDVKFEYVSIAQAEEIYGVIIDPVSGSADKEASEALRANKRRSEGENLRG